MKSFAHTLLFVVAVLSGNVLCGAVITGAAILKVDSIVNAGLHKGYYPGASLAIGNSGGMMYQKCYGWQDNTRSAAVSLQDVYDIASCTKIVSTTLVMMRLYDKGLVELDAKIGSIISEFAGSSIEGITVCQLLSHTSGLGNITVYPLLFSNTQGKPLISYKYSIDYPYAVDKGIYLSSQVCPDSLLLSQFPRDGYRRAGESCYINPAIDTLIINRIIRSYKPDRKGTYLYSDANFHILKLVIERISRMPLEECAAELFAQMQMLTTGYRPLQWISVDRIIPTENDILMQRGMLRGYCHDEIAAVCDNVGGNSGIFSNVSDLSNYCAMLLNKGRFADRQIISMETIELFTSSRQMLGFNRTDGKTALAGGYGHTGYTGTIIWIDPAKDLYLIFLSNRVNPSRINNGLSNSSLRTKLWETISKGKIVE